MSKYERLMPRIFAGARRVEIVDSKNSCLWFVQAGEDESGLGGGEVAVWAEIGAGIERRKLNNGIEQYRVPILSRQLGHIAWLITSFENSNDVQALRTPESLRRSFADATAFLQEEIELQAECDQLARELTERYEELNLVYSTKDQVEYFEEGQEALSRLVHNCADYLDVGLAALICRDRGISLHNVNKSDAPHDIETVMELLENRVYDRVEAQVQSVVLNESDDEERQRLFAGREENLLAYPIVDDHGAAIGLLAVVARRERHTFSNGDRNLLEVMAKKASRIIHTHHDSLTGLMNRNGFESSLVTLLASTRSNALQHGLLHIDVDQLHVVNDLMGHQEGDMLIRRVAKVIRSIVRESDFIARLGGDEFSALLTNCDLDATHNVADKIRNAIHELTVVSANRQLDVTASIGVASVDQDTDGIVSVMAAAEIACKAAKDAGRDRIEVFEEDNTSLIRRSEEVEWIGRVQEALRDDLFELFSQPVVPLGEDGDALHVEVLLRMRDESGEILSPAVFMPAAERYQLMPLVDRWVVRNACRMIREFVSNNDVPSPVFCINLSGQSLTNTGFLTFVIDEITQPEIDARNICFEITESAAISNIDDAINFMRTLKEFGCQFALDDFGAGLSSFGYLKVLPVDYLKIDGSFVREIASDPVSLAMVKAISSIGKTMQLRLVAEFVGDQETIDLLKSIGVDFGQGFFLGKPASLQAALDELSGRSTAITA